MNIVKIARLFQAGNILFYFRGGQSSLLLEPIKSFNIRHLKDDPAVEHLHIPGRINLSVFTRYKISVFSVPLFVSLCDTKYVREKAFPQEMAVRKATGFRLSRRQPDCLV